MDKRINTPFARTLDQRSTDAERVLWRALRARQLAGWKFRRQLPLGPYIADFVCIEARLAIELDGGQHVEQQIRDDVRIEYLESVGFRVIRFWDHEVLLELDAVLEHVFRFLASGHLHRGPLPPAGEGGH